MQLAIDNRTEKAQMLILLLEQHGYRFTALTGVRRGWAYKTDKTTMVTDYTEKAIKSLLEIYSKEAENYLTTRAVGAVRRCRDIAAGKGV